MRAAPLFTVILLTAGVTSGKAQVLTAGVTSEKAQEHFPRLSLADAGQVTEGDAFTLRCEVLGEGWKFLWLKVSEGGEMFDSGTGGNYTIRSAALVNSGQYWCFAERNDGLYYVSNRLNVQVTVSSTTPLTTASTTAKATAEKTDLAQASRSTQTPTPSNSERKTAVSADNTDQGKPHGSSLVPNTGLPVTARRAENTMLGSADQTDPGQQTESVFLQPWFLITAVLCSVLLVVSVILVLVCQPDQRYTVGHTTTFRRRGVQLIRYMEQEETPTGDTAMGE
ncbi:hypothetical protein AOXY_G33677 [Acipenser oxyrinchus oxyrinchus]|uniref:Ig-like domain-containing protein n=1 Tax=Acipenser oxyrinchus oxyrinchus TaxID=40147 RepID=A0AAD8FQS8_ACIOX|nr:hypothetical protein AOXY_G33677 [Acipenser oxyrinchus oxyrinchus]